MPVAKPSHQQVRDWMQQRRKEASPPPTPEDIRTELGWRMLEDERQEASGLAGQL